MLGFPGSAWEPDVTSRSSLTTSSTNSSWLAGTDVGGVTLGQMSQRPHVGEGKHRPGLPPGSSVASAAASSSPWRIMIYTIGCGVRAPSTGRGGFAFRRSHSRRSRVPSTTSRHLCGMARSAPRSSWSRPSTTATGSSVTTSSRRWTTFRR